jgi:hypothetical protein
VPSTADNTQTAALTLSATGSASGGTEVTTLQGTAGSGSNDNGGNLIVASGVSTGNGTSQMQFNVYGAGSSGSAANAATVAMTIANTGYVGIGTTSPAYLLHVGSTAASGIVAELQNSAGTCTLTPDSSSLRIPHDG